MFVKEDIVSIIVPVYKVENEIDRCIQSILNQTYTSIEIILVDDGSPDKCPEICDAYAKQDKRIKVIHKENGGLSDARNVGLDVAKGEYIAFIDSDDWVEDSFIEQLLTNLISTNSDISICGYTLVNENNQKRHYSAQKDLELLENEEALRELFTQEKFGCMVWQKLYRKELFKDIRFPVNKLYEDVAVSLPLFIKSKQCVISNKELYFYFQRNSSIVNSRFNKNKLDMLEFIQNMIDYSHANEHKFDNETEAFYLKAVLMNILQSYKDNSSKEAKECAKYLKGELKKHKKYIWGNKYLERRRKVVIYAIMMNFPARILVEIWEARMKAKYE